MTTKPFQRYPNDFGCGPHAAALALDTWVHEIGVAESRAALDAYREPSVLTPWARAARHALAQARIDGEKAACDIAVANHQLNVVLRERALKVEVQTSWTLEDK